MNWKLMHMDVYNRIIHNFQKVEAAKMFFDRTSSRYSSVQSLSYVPLFATPWITARQASLSITISRTSLKFISIQSVMPSSHLILCRPLLLLPPIPPTIRVFSTLHMRWPKYPSNCTKAWYIYIMKYNSVLRRNKLSSHEMTWRKQMHITKWKKPIRNGYLLYVSNYMTFWKWSELWRH